MSRQSHAEGIEFLHAAYIGALLLLCILAFVACTARAEDLPDAPILRSVAVKVVKKRPFLMNRTNLALIGADFASRTLDAVSTRQFMGNPCHCMVEKGTFYGTFSLAPIAQTTPRQLAYSWGMSALATGESALLWHFAEHSKHRRVMEWVARAPLAYDAGNNLAYGFIHNERLIAREK